MSETKTLISKNGKNIIIDADWHDMLSAVQWNVNPLGYVVNGKNGIMCRIIMDAPRGLTVDHINGIRFDNRRSNLRLCTRAENNRNTSPRCNTSSKYKGVNFHKNTGKWRAYITLNGKTYPLGYYKTESEAAMVYNKSAEKYHGEFCKLNIVVDEDFYGNS